MSTNESTVEKVDDSLRLRNERSTHLWRASSGDKSLFTVQNAATAAGAAAADEPAAAAAAHIACHI